MDPEFVTRSSPCTPEFAGVFGGSNHLCVPHDICYVLLFILDLYSLIYPIATASCFYLVF